jgi:hypothetical protein
LQNFDLASDFGLFDCFNIRSAALTRFENLDDDALVVLSVDALVDFRVLSAPNLLDYLVVLLRAAKIKK